MWFVFELLVRCTVVVLAKGGSYLKDIYLMIDALAVMPFVLTSAVQMTGSLSSNATSAVQILKALKIIRLVRLTKMLRVLKSARALKSLQVALGLNSTSSQLCKRASHCWPLARWSIW